MTEQQMENLIINTVIEMYHQRAWINNIKNIFPVAEFTITCESRTPNKPTKEDYEHAKRMEDLIRDKFKVALSSYDIRVLYNFSDKMILISQIINGLDNMCVD